MNNKKTNNGWDDKFINAWNKAEEERIKAEQLKPPHERKQIDLINPIKLIVIINQKEFKL